MEYCNKTQNILSSSVSDNLSFSHNPSLGQSLLQKISLPDNLSVNHSPGQSPSLTITEREVKRDQN